VTCLLGVRARWRTDSLGEFYCPGCGGDRNHRRQHGRRWFRLFGAPVLPLGGSISCVQCTACARRFPVEVLRAPTTARLGMLLRDAQYAIVIAVLGAGGTGSRAAREAACEAAREAGFEEYGEAQLLAALAALGGLERPGASEQEGRAAPLAGSDGSALQLRSALDPLTAHLAPQGLQRLLLVGARVALADGPYRPAERELLTAVGCSLRLTAEEIDSLLDAAAHTPHQN